jgi:hypothetical protein
MKHIKTFEFIWSVLIIQKQAKDKGVTGFEDIAGAAGGETKIRK